MGRSKFNALLLASAAAPIFLSGLASAQTTAETQSNPPQLAEIIVTAQKRSENVKDVPISITALGGTMLASQHVVGIDDLARTTPAVSFAAGATGEGAGEGQESIVIRGVGSGVGAPTTGLYWDESPLILPGEVGTTQPKIFDLDRIEILRGPQGTLYGASSEGGTVKYIPKKADLNATSLFVSEDASYTAHGGPNDDLQLVGNIPLIAGKLAVRGALDLTYDSGWIDRYAHNPGDLTASNGTLETRGTNLERDVAARLSAVYEPSNGLKMTPSLYYQRVQFNDQPSSFLSMPAYEQTKSVDESGTDEFTLTDLNIQKDTPVGEITSISSYYYKHFNRVGDGTEYDPNYVVPYVLDPALPQYAAQADPALSGLPTYAKDNQVNKLYVQELRIASKNQQDKSALFRWIGGIYVSYDDYTLNHIEVAPGWNSIFTSIYGFSPDNPTLSPVSDPSDPTLWSGDKFAAIQLKRTTSNYAAYGQADISPIQNLDIGVGLRYDYFTLGYRRLGQGYFNVGNNDNYSSNTTDSAVNPKITADYKISDVANIYATVASGFRQKGANNPVPEGICAGDYETLGLKPEAASYNSDSLWSYEGGIKTSNREFTANLSGYYINWSNIQQQITLPVCGYAYVSNVGNAALYGTELELSWRVPQIRGLTLGFVAGAEHTEVTKALPGSPASVGQSLLFTPDATAVLSVDYSGIVLANRKFFGHIDYSWTGNSHGSFDVSGSDYNDSAYGVLNGNVGYSVGVWNFVIYGKNLLDDKTVIQHPDVNTVVEAYRVQPLTAGVRLSRQF